MRQLLFRAFVGAAGTFLAVGATRAAAPRVVAIENATVVAAPGRTIERGTIVLRNGLIEAVGASVRVPPDAVPIDGSGMWVYPGFIDADSTFGAAPETPAPARGRPSEDEADATTFGADGPSAGSLTESGPAHALARVRAEFRAVDQLAPFTGDRKREAEQARRLGFTVVAVPPAKGVFRGRSAVVLLEDDAPVADMVLKADAAQHVAFENGSFGDDYPTSLMGAVATIRQTLLDAGRSATWSERWRRNPNGLARPEQVASLAALEPVLAKRQGVVFVASDPGDVLLADRLAREFTLDAVVAASGFEAEILDQVAATGLTLLFPVRVPDKPKVGDPDEALDVGLRDLRRYIDAPSAPKRLHDANVPFALTTRGLKNPADFTVSVRKMIEAGLSEEAVLAALTTVPARVLGLDAVIGTLEPGKLANVLVADGPIFDKDARIGRVYVDGTEYKIEEKRKPKGDPNAVVDPRGTWSVVLEFGESSISRTWTVTGTREALAGTAETRSGTIAFDRVTLAGNVLTLVFPASEGRGSSEVTVIVRGDAFEGTAEFGPRTIPVRGTRTSGPEGGER